VATTLGACFCEKLEFLPPAAVSVCEHPCWPSRCTLTPAIQVRHPVDPTPRFPVKCSVTVCLAGCLSQYSDCGVGKWGLCAPGTNVAA
jgi:hypothetical protein